MPRSLGQPAALRRGRDGIHRGLNASILVLVLLCGGLAVLMVHLAGVDPMTAYPATGPAGPVAVITASGTLDRSFVMAMQSACFPIVLVTGQAVARLLARHMSRRSARATPDFRRGASRAIAPKL